MVADEVINKYVECLLETWSLSPKSNEYDALLRFECLGNETLENLRVTVCTNDLSSMADLFLTLDYQHSRQQTCWRMPGPS